MNTRTSYEKQLKDHLVEWHTKIDELKIKARKTEGEAKAHLQKQIDELQSIYENINNKLLKLKHASDESWEELKIGAEKAEESIRTAFQSTRSKFK